MVDKKKEVKEIVKIKKDGKEEVKEFFGKIKEKHASKKQIKKQEKQLGMILGVIGIFFIIILVAFLINRNATHFKYEELEFKLVKEGNIIFYQVPMVTQYQGNKLTYNFYLRTNPNDLKEVPFEGEIELKNNIILNVTTENLYCDGDWQIAIGNLMNLNVFNIDVLKDENLGCDENGNYLFININEGEESKIEQVGPSCYNLYISNCEVLPVTEKFMVETFLEINEFVEDYKWT
jgi:hypothetical protein